MTDGEMDSDSSLISKPKPKLPVQDTLESTYLIAPPIVVPEMSELVLPSLRAHVGGPWDTLAD